MFSSKLQNKVALMGLTSWAKFNRPFGTQSHDSQSSRTLSSPI